MKILKYLNNAKIFWPVIFIMTVVKNIYYFYSYLPIVDDNNAYGIFRLYNDKFHDVILHYKTYTVRPVAGLLDAYFWDKFWNVFGLTLFITTLLLMLTYFLIYKVFEKCGLKTGAVLAIIFLLLTFGSEATYWLSASTRIVVGLLFVALSMYILCLYIERRDNTKRDYALLSLFLITHLLSLGFYEQIIALSFASFALIFIYKWKDIKYKWVVLIPVFNYAAIAFWYKIFSNEGNMASRGQVLNENYFTHTYKVVKAIYIIWKKNLNDFFSSGFIKGLKVVLNDGAYVFLAIVVVISIIVFIIAKNEKHETGFKKNAIKFLIGCFLFAVPYIPFFAINLIWICNRNLFLSFIGLGLMTEALLNIISRNRILIIIKSAFISLMVFAFLIGNVHELNYYRNIGIIDKQITSKVASLKESEDYFNGTKTMLLFNAKPSYVNTLSNQLTNCTGVDWALTGALEAQNNVAGLKIATPVRNGAKIKMKKEALQNSVLLAIDEEKNVFSVKTEKEKQNNILLIKSDGSTFGQLVFLQDDMMEFHLE